MLDDNKTNDEIQENEENLDTSAEEETKNVENTAEDTELTNETEDEDTADEEVADEAEAKADDNDEEEDDDEDDVEELGEEVVGTGAHDDYDWNSDTRHGHVYSKEEAEKYEEQYASTMTAVWENEIVSGKVTSINDGDVVLDINYKSDGLVPLSEFRDTPDMEV